MTTPRVVTANPELGWVSVDDQIWLAPLAVDGSTHVPDETMPEVDRLLAGNLLEVHNDPRPEPDRRHGLGWIDIQSGKKHRVTSRDPLTIEPSIACAQGCGFHGFITNGRWVPA